MSSNNNLNANFPIHKVSQSYEILNNYFINYVQTIKGQNSNMNSAKSLVSKTFLKFEKLFRPVNLKLIKRKDSTVDIVIRRLNLEQEYTIQVCNVDEDKMNYLYLEVIDESNSNRIHIFNVISEVNLKEIQTINPLFGSNEDKIQHQYLIPDKMTDVVCSIQTFCLPTLGKHVSKMKDQMSEQIRNVFQKFSLGSNSLRMKLSNSIKRESFKIPKNYKSFVKAQTRSISPGIRRKNIPVQKLNTKSQSIENLLLQNSAIPPITSFSKHDYMIDCTNELQKCFSTHSSLNENENNSSSEQINYYKFEYVLQDKCGLKHFKNFLSKEFSSENIYFWEAVNNFSKLTDYDLMKKEAQKIFYTYMDPNSTEQNVNLENHMIENVKNNLDSPEINIFDNAKNHVYHVMKNDSYTRFLKSPHFDSLINEIKCDSNMTSAVSSSSLSPSKKKKFKITNPFKSGSKSSAEVSRKSSILTIDSDISSSLLSQNILEITMAFDDYKVHIVTIEPNKKLNYYLKKINKKINENDFVVYDKNSYEIINFFEILDIYRNLVVDYASLIRIGYVSDSIDTKLFEDFYFVVKCRSSMCLTDLVHLIIQYLPRYIDKVCIIQENNPKLKLGFDTPVSNYHHSVLLFMELSLFDKVKFFGKELKDSHDTLWKRIMKDNVFQNNLPFDKKNVLDSRCELFKGNQLNSRQVGFKTINTDVYQNHSNLYDDQRGLCTEEQLETPEYLKSSQTTDVSKVHSEFEFSDFDSTSDNSPEKYEVISDFD